MALDGTVAVLGAGGFIGNRLVEVLHLSGKAVCPIVRQPSALALSKRFDLDGRTASADDEAGLHAALRFCEVVVHAAAGTPREILRMVQPVVRAAARAGCRRIVYLSSAMVHGQSPPPNSEESTPLPADQRLAYNLAKLRAERLLFQGAREYPVEVCALRPGIVYGPRSQWVGGLADALLNSSAYLVEGGRGLMNAVYIDNLVHAVLLALTEPQAAGQSFLIGEDQTPTWREYSNRLRVAMDLPPEVIHDVGFETRAPTFSDRINTLRESKAVRATLRRLPYPLQEALAAGWSATGMMPVQTGEPMANLETALLHRARHVPTWEKARTMLKYQPLISAEEAWARTIAWLKFAGYSTSAS